MVKKISTYIFDMDGVIIDSEPIHMRIEASLFKELGLDISNEKHQTYVGMSSIDMWTSVVNEMNISQVPEVLVKEKNLRYLQYMNEKDKIEPIAGVKKLITYLYQSNKKLAVASSATRDEIIMVLKKTGLSGYFPIIVSGAELPKSKPDPSIFIKTANLVGSQYESCCVIEDSENGVLAAKGANMKCIGYKNPNSGNQDLSKANFIIDSFSNCFHLFD